VQASISSPWIRGVGVAANLTRAAELFGKACEGGHADACKYMAEVSGVGF
jgi:TPR repeat protein